MHNLIHLENVTTGYGHKAITRNINATLYPGELTCLLGANGAGKSTLLKTLCAFILPMEGKIMIDETNISNISPRVLAKHIGVVLTERPSTINMSVKELVTIGRTPYTSFFGGLKLEDKEIVNKSMQLVGIDNLQDRVLHTLSDGERQKAYIAKALSQQTQIIVLDEPTAFLDYPSKVEIMKLLYKIAREENKIIFMSTHDIELALQLADKLWLMDREKGLKIGTPLNLSSNGIFADYFERPGLSFDSNTLTFKINK